MRSVARATSRLREWLLAAAPPAGMETIDDVELILDRLSEVLTMNETQGLSLGKAGEHIAALTAERDALRKALGPFVEFDIEKFPPSEYGYTLIPAERPVFSDLDGEDFRRARAVLAKEPAHD